MVLVSRGLWLGVVLGASVARCEGLGYRQVELGAGLNGTNPDDSHKTPESPSSSSSEESRQSKIHIQTTATGFESDPSEPTDIPIKGAQSRTAKPQATEKAPLGFTESPPQSQPPSPGNTQPTLVPQQTSTSNAGTNTNDEKENSNPPKLGQVAAPQTTPQPTAPLPPSIITQNGQTLTPHPESTLIIDGQTLTPGGTITVHDTQIFIPSSGGYPTLSLSDGRASTVRTITPAPTVVGGQTLSIRGLPVTIGGTGPSATTLSINDAGSTLAWTVNGPIQTLANPLSGTVVFGADITATFAAQNFVYDVNNGQATLKADGTPITIDGTTIAVSTDAAHRTVVAVGSKTTTLEAAPTGIVDLDDGVRVTVVDGSTRLVVGGKTVAPGEGVSVVMSGGSAVVVVGGRSTTVEAPGAGATGSTTASGKKDGKGEENSSVVRFRGVGLSCVVGVWMGVVGLGLGWW